jgi:ribosomal protein S18 acetylase RimI-like enzyme
VQVMFNRQPHLKVEGHEHHYWADEIDALHEQHRARGAPIISPIDNKPWHIREYTVCDPNGYHLRFSGPLSYEKPPSAAESKPDYIDIEERRPTFEEFLAIQQAVGWGKTYESYEIVKTAFTSFLAIDHRQRRPVGMTRVMLDSLGWYSIWDVAVVPEYQGQKIGTAMVEAAVKRLRDHSPGAFVFLFTMKPGFYARLGFRDDGCSMLKL